jgi:hypothetical protein
LVKWLGSWLSEGGTCISIPISVAAERTSQQLDASDLIFRIARVSMQDVDRHSSILKALEIAHMILVGVGNEKVVDSRSAHSIPDEATG